MDIITSRDNAGVKYACTLRDSEKQRAAEGLFFAEGPKLCLELAKSCTPRTAYATEAAMEKAPALESLRPTLIAPHVAEKLAGTKTSQGVFVLFEQPAPPVERLDTATHILALEGVQDPGNVGTVIRTAAALGFDTVILCGACADVYSPKTARATMGAIFRENIVRMDITAAAEYIHRRGMKLYGAALSERAADIRTAELKDAVVAIGSEGRGLSAELLSLCDGEVIIPMTPGSESFNAAIAAAIVMWEIVR